MYNIKQLNRYFTFEVHSNKMLQLKRNVALNLNYNRNVDHSTIIQHQPRERLVSVIGKKRILN